MPKKRIKKQIKLKPLLWDWCKIHLETQGIGFSKYVNLLIQREVDNAGEKFFADLDASCWRMQNENAKIVVAEMNKIIAKENSKLE